MNKQKGYIQALVNYINSIHTCYYEEVPSKRSYPYCVLSVPNASGLEMGDLLTFDIEIYATENEAGEVIEDVADKLKIALNKKLLNLKDVFNSHISFENYNTLKDNEYDLLARVLSFSARIFYI